MKVTGKPVPTSVGVFFIAFALVGAMLVFPSAKESQSPFLFDCVFGGIFVGVPAALGIGIVYENRRKNRCVRKN
jgi:hypothetical protein